MLIHIFRKVNIRIFLSIFVFSILWPAPIFGVVGSTPSEIKSLSTGEKVQVQGIVIVEPGVLGKQIFYLDGIQIYSYYKDFPGLKIGDKISVTGEISQSHGEKRIKIKTKEDILLLNGGVVIEPKFLSINAIDTQFLGNLIKIKGLVIEKTGQEIFINDDTGELTVYIKEYTDIDKSVIKEGDNAEITGILSLNNDKLRLLPRNDKDISVIKVPEKKEEARQIQLLASEAGAIDFYRLKPYFIISAVVLGLIFVILLFLEKRRNG